MHFKIVSIYFIFVFLFNAVCAELRSAKSYKRRGLNRPSTRTSPRICTKWWCLRKLPTILHNRRIKDSGRRMDHATRCQGSPRLVGTVWFTMIGRIAHLSTTILRLMHVLIQHGPHAMTVKHVQIPVVGHRVLRSLIIIGICVIESRVLMSRARIVYTRQDS